MYKKFSNWMDDELKQLKKEKEFKKVNAVYFCLEEINDGYSCQLFGCEKYFPNDDDWAYPKYLIVHETLFKTDYSETSIDWEKTINVFRDILKKYLKVGTYKKTLLNKQAVAIGFGDGDLYVDYINSKNISIV